MEANRRVGGCLEVKKVAPNVGRFEARGRTSVVTERHRLSSLVALTGRRATLTDGPRQSDLRVMSGSSIERQHLKAL